MENEITSESTSNDYISILASLENYHGILNRRPQLTQLKNHYSDSGVDILSPVWLEKYHERLKALFLGCVPEVYGSNFQFQRERALR